MASLLGAPLTGGAGVTNNSLDESFVEQQWRARRPLIRLMAIY
jgi:hypothetical protein